MERHGVGALLVMEGDKLCGVISERDYARKIILKGKASKETPVRDIMTRPVIYVSEDETVENCMALMTQKRVRHLPVLTEGRVVGVVSIGDVVKAMLTEKDLLIDQLARYISTG
ncbi:MAG: CBS domain-containing protein [Lentisphaeria bacterium]